MESTYEQDMEQLFEIMAQPRRLSGVREFPAGPPDQLALPGFTSGPDSPGGAGARASDAFSPVRELKVGGHRLSRFELLLAAYSGACDAARPYLRRAMFEVIKSEGVTTREYITAYVIFGMEREG